MQETKDTNNWVYFQRIAINLAALKPDRRRLDPDVKKAWIDALWFGFYKQGQHELCNAANEFCCLGVKHKLEGTDNHKLQGIAVYFGRDVFALGLRGRLNLNEGDVMFDGMGHSEKLSLVALNDTGATFREIAFVIEQIF